MLYLCADFWKTVETINGSSVIKFGNNLKAIWGSINDLVEPESISILVLYSGNVIYASSLGLVLALKEIICGVIFRPDLRQNSENFRLKCFQSFRRPRDNSIGFDHHNVPLVYKGVDFDRDWVQSDRFRWFRY